jgi:mitochondrial chaperone BCS1
MIGYINELFVQFTTFAKLNPVISGIVSLWGLGVVTFLFREVPSQIWKVIVKQFTVRVVINCQDEAFYNLIKWYENQGYGKKARTLRLNNGRNGVSQSKEILSAGYGNHYFIFKGLPFRLCRNKEESGNLYYLRENLEVVTIGRSQKPIRDLLFSCNPNTDSSAITKVFKWDEGHWSYSHDQLVRSLDSITIENENKTKLIDHLNKFKNDKTWYLKHCIPYRTGLCLFGPPGTGKTSLVRSICGLDERDLYILNLNVMTDKGLEEAVDTVGKNAVLLIEDIDSFKATNNREESKNKKNDNTNTSSLTLSGILNAIDGISASDGRILVITTNRLEDLDSALMRPGRIDLRLNLSHLNECTVKDAFKRFFPDFKIPNFRLKKDLTPAEFQNVVMQNKDDPIRVLEGISLHDIEKDEEKNG